NLKLFTAPTIKLPNTLEVYEPEHSESVTTTINGMQGFIGDSYTVVPQFKGTYPINPISFSFCDPKTEKYRTITSKEFTIEVENGPLSNATAGNTSNEVNKQVVLSKDNFKYIKLDANLKPITQDSFFKSA